MEQQHDQEMYALQDDHDPYQSSVYSSSADMLSFQTPTSFVMSSHQHARQRFPPSDIPFRSHNHHNHHEAEHVYNSPQLTLDPSTLDLRPNHCDDIPPLPPSSISHQSTGSSSTTPTGSLRISTYNLSSGAVTRRKPRAALEQLQIQTQLSSSSSPSSPPPLSPPSALSVELQQQQRQPHSFHPNHDSPNQTLHHQASDMHDVQMQQGELQMHVDDHHHQPLIGSIHHHSSDSLAPHSHVYSVLSDTSTTTSSSGYYLSSSDTFPNSPATVSTPADASPPSDLQPISPTSTLSSSPSSTVPLARSFRSGSLSLGGLTANRSLSLITSTSTAGSIGGQPISPSNLHAPSALSSHPHMHPTPYYGSASPAYPSTPPALSHHHIHQHHQHQHQHQHHTQGSSSSSRSSGQTHYSLRGSPVPRAFGRGHGRSSSYGTAGSTMSVRSTSPASSVTSAFTSLSGGGGGGGGGSTPSTTGPLGSPISYGENGDAQMPFTSSQELPPPSHFHRAHSPPTTIIPNYAPPPPPLPPSSHHRKSFLGHEPYATMRTSTPYMESPRDSVGWPGIGPNTYIPSGSRLTDEEFQAQFPPAKQLMTRAPHRKQKLANSDRKAICMYAKQHPSARQEDIAARYNVERSTISKILKNKERWLGCPDDDAKVARKRKPRFDELELVLKLWVEEARPQKLVLSDALIRSKAKEEARRLGILEDKFKASSGWLENFKHRVGIRKGKYIGRDHWQEGGGGGGSESDFDDPNSQKYQQEQRGAAVNWSKSSHPGEGSKGSWDLSMMGSTSPMKDAGHLHQQLTIADLTGKQSGFPSEGLNTAQSSPQVIDARPGSRHENHNNNNNHYNHYSHQHYPQRQVGPVMRKTRSRTLAESKQIASASSAELPNQPPSPSLSSSAAAAAVTVESNRAMVSSDNGVSVPATIQMETNLLSSSSSRPRDASHSIAGSDSPSPSPHHHHQQQVGEQEEEEEPNSPVGKSESRGASEPFGATLNLVGSQGFSAMANGRD